MDPLAVEENNYATNIVNAYMLSDLHNWPNNPLRNFTLKNGLFGATSILKNNYTEKWMYSGYGIAFDRKVEWSFGNDYARDVIIFGVDNSSSSHADNCKNDF